ncbi:MAG: TIGR02996 domain-containing protein [Myxococcota bacterium]
MYYEHHARGSFVETTAEGRTVRRRFGQMGALGQVRLQTLDTPPQAAEVLRREHHRLLRKGYWPGHHDPDLVAAIRRAPDDPGGFAVYADWLEEREDPRAELVRRDRPAPEPARRLGPSAPDVFETGLQQHERQFVPPLEPAPELGWAHGFVVDATFDGWPGHWTSPAELWGVLRRLFGHPSGHFVRRLVFVGRASRIASGIPEPFGRPKAHMLVRGLALAPCLREVALPAGAEPAFAGHRSPVPLVFR